jgi:hypothetical protein
MPRMTINLTAGNIEQLQFKSDEIKGFLDESDDFHIVREKITTAIDEAYQQIAEESSELEYVVIKIIK